MAYDATANRVVFFGGGTNSANPTDEVWLWDGSDWSLSNAAAGPPAQTGSVMVEDRARSSVVLFALGEATISRA